MLGAGMVIVQNPGKIVVVFEEKKKYWFLPRGRKDRGESLEQTALREGYEEVTLSSFLSISFGPLFFILVSEFSSAFGLRKSLSLCSS
jgi:8-oxo-dGTP pyrophosphatase MutT (NUDIX family)